MEHVESPVTVRFPWMRLQTAYCMALWADPDRLQLEWVEQPGNERVLDLYGQLGRLMEDFDLMPEFEHGLGDILATPREVDRLAKVSGPLENLLAEDGFRWDDLAGILTTVHWAEIVRRSGSLLQLLVLDGGCWDYSDPVTEADELVDDYFERSRLAVSLASLAEGDPNQSIRATPPPLWLAAEGAGDIVNRATAPEHWDRTRATVLVDQHGETERVARVGRALSGGSDPADVPTLARRALTAIVGNSGGWQYDHL